VPTFWAYTCLQFLSYFLCTVVHVNFFSVRNLFELSQQLPYCLLEYTNNKHILWNAKVFSVTGLWTEIQSSSKITEQRKSQVVYTLFSWHRDIHRTKSLCKALSTVQKYHDHMKILYHTRGNDWTSDGDLTKIFATLAGCTRYITILPD